MFLIVVGIDPSFSGTGIVVLQEGKVRVKELVVTSPQKSVPHRVLSVVTAIELVLINAEDSLGERPALVVVEGFSYASKGRAIFDTAYLGWRIREELIRLEEIAGISWMEVSPSLLKKFATGKGNANKDLVLLQVYKRWGEELTDTNIADAFVLAKIGEAYLGVDVDKLTDFQKEVIKKLKRGKENGERQKQKSN